PAARVAATATATPARQSAPAQRAGTLSVCDRIRSPNVGNADGWAVMARSPLPSAPTSGASGGCGPGLQRQPVDAADPLGAVVRVPLDRAPDALFPRDLRSPPRLPVELVVADAYRHHLARAGPVARRRRHDLAAGGPEAAFLADAQDQRRPLGHRDVLALPVHVHVPRDSVRGDGEMAADAVGAEAEVAQRLQRPELDPL